MTTHYEKIQALGNRMASNLETMGVSASFNDGGLTLADKILQIQRFTNGLLLYADKNIIQTGDTVNLYALLVEDGKAISGETIKFDFGTIVSSKQVSMGDDIYDDYYVESSKTGSNYDYIGTGHTGYIQFNSSTIKTYVTSFSPEVTYNGEPFHIKDGVLTYKDTLGNIQTIDVSAINTSKAYSGAACTIHYHWMESTTNSCGVATVGYTGKGAGVLNIKAVHGIIQSERYTITDCTFIDNGTTSDHNEIWYNQSNTTVTIGDNYTELTETNSGTSFIYRFKSANKISQGTCVELDVYQVDGTNSDLIMSFLNTSGAGQTSIKLSDVNTNIGNWVHFKLKWDNDQLLINDSVTKNLTISEGYFAFTSPSDTTTIRFKNVNVYPI